MARARGFTVVVATDGSPIATAAVNGVAAFPWPPGTRVHGVVVRGLGPSAELPASARADLERSLGAIAEGARTTLARRWPDAKVRVVDGPVVNGIVGHAERVGARVIALGSHGHSAIARLLIGSTSLGVVRAMRHAALVMRGRVRSIGRVVVGFEGSPSARHAIAFLARLAAPSDGHVTLVRVIERASMPSLALLPAGTRAAVAQQVASVQAAEEERARRELEAAAAELRRAGWKVDVALRHGPPLDELLAAVKRARAQLVVVGARGHGAVERLVLGSVAEGALHRSPVSVLVTR